MILVTGAAGKTGRALVSTLATRGAAVRALVRRDAQRRALESLGAQEIVVADMLRRDQLDEAVRGAEKLYHICPNMHPEEVTIGRNVIASAQAYGCEQVVYHSVLHPQTQDMPHHWLKLQVEERLFKSGLSFTILQPAAYLQNLLSYWPGILERGVYAIPYAADTRVSMVDLLDVAEVGAKVLTEPGHERATYELSGPQALTQYEVAEILTCHLGRPVHVDVVPRPQWKEQARSGGLGAYQVETLEKMFAYYEQYDFIGNSHVLEWILGRRPATLAEFVARTIDRTL